MSRERWIIPSLDKNEREILWRRHDSRAGLDLALRLVCQALLISAALTLLNSSLWVVAVPVVIANAIVWTFMGWAGIGHELFHNTVFSSRRLNVSLFRVMSVLTWNNYAFFETSHWRHHKRTMWDDDPETRLECHISAKDLPWLVTFNLPGAFRRFRILLGNSLGYIPDRLDMTLNDTARSKLIRGARIVIAAQSFLILVFVLSGQLWLILLISLATFTFSLPVHALEVAQHCGLERNVWDYRRNTRTVLLDPVLGFFYANMNYHIEHHMFPGIPYYNLPKARALLVEKHELSECVPTSFMQALRVSLKDGDAVPGVRDTT